MKTTGLLVISSYPPFGETHNKKVVGIASFTKNTLSSLSRLNEGKFKARVLAEVLDNEKNYKENNVEVLRVWKRGSIFAFPSLLKKIYKSPEPVILFEFEHAMFGNIISLIPLPLFLLITEKMLGKKIIFVFHQVIGDLKNLHGHINIPKSSFKIELLNILIFFFYKAILLSVTKAVVFEDELKERLARLGDKKKIVVIPHGVEKFRSNLTYQSARTKLEIGKNDFLLLSFGFLAWYKGTDILVKQFSSLSKDARKNVKLIIAGGPNPNHIGKKFYDDYVAKIQKESDKNGISVTGFLPEDKIPVYFEASDLIVFPYRTFMSSSGPLSIALSYNKPFIVSENLQGLAKSSDFKKALENSSLENHDLIFKEGKFGLENKIKALRNERVRDKMIKFSKLLAKEREFGKVAKLYEELIEKA
ncbi:MAG TPA: glycosyltransferase [Patescibacteria group bacterium]|nr:glycosyltransferase [Patescibacteria group bacterium]